MISKEFPLTPTGCRLVQENLDTADFNVVLQIAILSHCQKCLSCHKYSQELTGLRTLLVSQVRIQAPNDFDIKLRQKIAASKNPRLISPWWQWVSQPALGATLAAVTVVGVLVGVDYYRQPTTVPLVAASPSPEAIINKNTIANVVKPNPRIEQDSLPSSSGQKPSVEEEPKIITRGYVASSGRRIPRQVSPQPPKQISLDEINVEIHYGSASRTLPLSAITYGSKPVLNVDNVSTRQIKNTGAIPEARIF
ncbi:MAG: hypothetical protein FD167_2874 [bacterium]|nr:MAG: hypothetical protein FD167_2874 [bacterium]